jgi:hypothetical protein
LDTITGKAAEFSMLSPKRIQFFSLIGRPPRQALRAGLFALFKLSSFFPIFRYFSSQPIPVVSSNHFPGPFDDPSPTAMGVNLSEIRTGQKWPINK